jgi:hypothetical protein
MTWEITVPQNAESAQAVIGVSPIKLNVGKSEKNHWLSITGVVSPAAFFGLHLAAGQRCVCTDWRTGQSDRIPIPWPFLIWFCRDCRHGVLTGEWIQESGVAMEYHDCVTLPAQLTKSL